MTIKLVNPLYRSGLNDNGNMRKCTIKIKLLQHSFENHFCDFVKEENYILVFINPFSLSEQKCQVTQMELLDFESNLILKMKFDALFLKMEFDALFFSLVYL